MAKSIETIFQEADQAAAQVDVSIFRRDHALSGLREAVVQIDNEIASLNAQRAEYTSHIENLSPAPVEEVVEG